MRVVLGSHQSHIASFRLEACPCAIREAGRLADVIIFLSSQDFQSWTRAFSHEVKPAVAQR